MLDTIGSDEQSDYHQAEQFYLQALHVAEQLPEQEQTTVAALKMSSVAKSFYPFLALNLNRWDQRIAKVTLLATLVLSYHCSQKRCVDHQATTSPYAPNWNVLDRCRR